MGGNGSVAAIAPPSRTSSLGVDPMFLDRWSPRALRRDPLSTAEAATLFEAARWAPSGGNQQPWLFVYADAEPQLERLREVLVPGNRVWAQRAPLLAVLFARKRTTSGDANPTAAFDAGAAWMSLALQARKLGLYAHAMGGFVKERAHEALGVDPAEWEALAAIAVGRPGDQAELPAELRARERPSDRKPLGEVARRI